jgi:hypothetical protein
MVSGGYHEGISAGMMCVALRNARETSSGDAIAEQGGSRLRSSPPSTEAS